MCSCVQMRQRWVRGCGLDVGWAWAQAGLRLWVDTMRRLDVRASMLDSCAIVLRKITQFRYICAVHNHAIPHTIQYLGELPCHGIPHANAAAGMHNLH